MADIERTSVSNSLIDNYSPNVDGQEKPSKIAVENYYVWLQKMPEVAGVVGAICNDIMGDGFEFRGESKAGVKAAQEFVR